MNSKTILLIEDTLRGELPTLLALRGANAVRPGLYWLTHNAPPGR
ncbi:MAG: hypothetical protein ACU841_04295 [Gammaproteobacteria bacterium]